MRYRWPDGNQCAVVLTFDFDAESAYHFREPKKARKRLDGVEERRYGPRVGVPRILRLLERYQLPATFFTPGFTIEHHTEAAKSVRDASFIEMACHGNVHESVEEPVVYHVLLPLEDAAARIEASMGSLAGGEVIASPAMVMDDTDLAAIRRDAESRTQHELEMTLEALKASGSTADGVVITQSPVDALADKVAEVEAAETIILTRPHVVAEFFHVDWTSRARRKLGVPVLHLVEIDSPAAEQDTD